MEKPAQSCPHCGSQLKKWRVPEGATWSAEFFYVCFNDECSYFRQGWQWMMEQFNQSASYRYALNPRTGACMPIPVWSAEATREMIEDEAGEEEA